MFIAAAILLSQELRGSSGESMPTQIARAVTNAEKLQEEIRKRRKDLARTQQADAEGLNDHIPDDQFPTPGPLMP
jgi:hypothetical protein